MGTTTGVCYMALKLQHLLAQMVLHALHQDQVVGACKDTLAQQGVEVYR
jgi:hypothetical protein